MGWNVSHGTDRNGEIRRSYTSVANFANRLEAVVPPTDWLILRTVFRPGSGDPHQVDPITAVTIANILDRAATSWRLKPGGWGRLAAEYAAAARRAAAAGQPWRWH